ncbi:MAG TPA: ribonuclease H-like domain-containing protein [Candidatus Dormibacteraeota bacterium]|nr:ribonuclease H-like domain-containing protein [Candidatus Dormibacteraeota bacterium]
MDAEVATAVPAPPSTLRERLTRLGAPPRPRPQPPRVLPRGFEEVKTPSGIAAMRQDVIPLPALDPCPGSVAYLDTETTGLTGGAGTYVFAAAVARPIDCGLRVAQLFLPQPGMEPAFLHALHQELEPAEAVATFNGGSFDLPVLRTRWVMARMPGEFSHAPHVDLLTLVRALYRHRLETCNLRAVEERVLGYERDDPLPSSLVPDAYFDFLRAGSMRCLEAALEHNRLDVISLVHLHSRLLLRLHGDETGMDAADWLALGRHRFRRGARADGWRALRNAMSFVAGEAAATAGLLITRRLLRHGAVATADQLLRRLEAATANDVRLSVARARLLEWRRRDASEALRVVEAAQRRMPEAAPSLEHRRTRLARKVESGSRRGDGYGHRGRRQRKVRQVQLEAPLGDGAL